MHAKPGQLAMIVKAPEGETRTVYDGRTAFVIAPTTDRPIPLMELTGGDLDGAKLDAELFFPAGIKQALRQWRVTFPSTIDDHEVQVLQGTSDGRYPINLYFDKNSGLLLRQVRYTESPLGLNPTQVDYADYRPVAGVQIPFKRTITWLDGRSIIQLTDVQPNVPVDAAKFERPRAK